MSGPYTEAARAKLYQAAQLIDDVARSLSSERSSCAHCGMTRWASWAEHKDKEMLEAEAKRLRTMASPNRDATKRRPA